MVAANTSSPSLTLLDLPTEIRIHIFESLRDVTDCSLLLIRPRWVNPLYRDASKLAIIRVSRQLRHEALPILFGASTLVLSFDHEETVRRCRSWLDDIDPLVLSHVGRYELCDFLHDCSMASCNFIRKIDTILNVRAASL